MSKVQLLDLTDCSAYGQAIRYRPPKIVHGVLTLSILLLAVSVVWAAWAEANLVIRARGRVRPLSEPRDVFNDVSLQAYNAGNSRQVLEVNCREGDPVQVGDVLLRLDAQNLESDLARLELELRAGEEELVRLQLVEQRRDEQFEAQCEKLDAELAAAEGQTVLDQERKNFEISLAEIQLERARAEATRLRKLAADGIVSPQELESATTDLQEALQRYERAKVPTPNQQVEVLKLTRHLADKQHAVQEAELEQERARMREENESLRIELQKIQRELANTIVRAPIEGVVTAGNLRAGDSLEWGKPLMTIAPKRGLRIDVKVSSEDVVHLREGMPARVRLDAYDDQSRVVVPGEVLFVAPDSTEPRNSHQASNAGYTVRIRLDPQKGDGTGFRDLVKLGLTGEVEIVIGQKSLLSLLIKTTRRRFTLG